MITIKVDFNHRDSLGRFLLTDLKIHKQTPFETIAASDKPILFVQEEDIVYGKLFNDPEEGWVGIADWDTQDVLEEYPERALLVS